MNTKLENSTDLKLTKGQEAALAKINDFLDSDQEVFILKGYAGTGKTTLINEIISELKRKRVYFEVLAPTGRAAKILRDRAGEGKTIHSGIYNLEEFQTINDESEDQAEKSFHYVFPIRDNKDVNRVCIIDEASMVSDAESKNEFFTFGTNRLLYDILTYMKMPKSGNKLIFIGDPAQLPPIKDSDSKALSVEHFHEKNIATKDYLLTEILRQKSDSKILKNATKFRKALEKQTRNNLNLEAGEDVIQLSISDVVETYLDEFPSPTVGSGVIINYSNKQCLSYNQMIREELYPGKQCITRGDIVMINNNNYHTYEVELLNGQMAEVTWVSPDVEPQSAPVYFKEGGEKRKKIITLHFRDIKIKVPEHSKEIPCKIIGSLLNSPNADLSEDEFKSLYINFNIRFNKKQKVRSDKGLPRIKPGSDQFKELVRNDPYYNALRVKYGYSITCHKSQGGEWETAFVNFDGRVGLKDAHLRWGYTAITRAAKKLYVLNPPQISEYSGIKFDPITKMGGLSKHAIQYNNVPETPFHDKSSHPGKKLKYFEVLDKIEGKPYELKSVDSRDYQEMYSFEYGEEKARFDATHNSAGVFNRFKSSDSDEWAKELTQLLNSPFQNEVHLSYKPTETYLQKLYGRMRAECDELEIQITNIVEEIDNYYVIYYLQLSGNQFASIQFYFNKNGQFSKALPKVQEVNSSHKLKSLIGQLS